MKKCLPENRLRVILFGTEIGQLAWNSKAGRSYFFFSPQYFDMKIDIAPIIAPKDSQESHYAIYGNTEKRIYQKLPPFIADSLPDDWGNTLFDQWFKDNGFLEKDKNPIAKLSFIGKRAMGAFEFLPCNDDIFDDSQLLSLGNLYSLATKIEMERNNAVILPEESLTKKALLSVGTSAGGRFKKAIVATAPDGTIHSGQTSVKPDWKYYIIKFNNPVLCLSEIEQTYYEMAIESGIEMEQSGLIEVEGIRHFKTERFDRKNGKKLLVMSLAAINPDANSYEDLFRTCIRLGIPECEQAQLFRRMAFNVMASNTDDHAKNFSFVMNDDGSWHLSKAYDINFIFRTLNQAETDHCFTVRGKSNSITAQDLILFAKEYNIKSAQSVLSGIWNVLDSFGDKALKNGIRGDIAETINCRLVQIRHEMLGSETDTPNWPSFVIDGRTVSEFHFEKDKKGTIIVLATVDGVPAKKHISSRHPDYLIIAERFNSSPTSLKKRIAKDCFINTTDTTRR